MSNQSVTKLQWALLSLMKTESFTEISVSKLSARAEVSRVTFYKNFKNKEDLLNYVINNFFDKLNKIYLQNIKFTDYIDFSDTEKIKKGLLPNAQNITHFFYSERETIQALMSPNSGIDFMKGIYGAFHDEFEHWLPQKFSINYDPYTLEEYSRYLTKGVALIIGTWFRKDFEDDPEQISQILVNILSLNLHSLYVKNIFK